jgi:hypothetical protein
VVKKRAIGLTTLGKSISFTKALGSGFLTITAANAEQPKQNSITLSNVHASFKKGKKLVVVDCQHCEFKPESRKAFLKGKVNIKSGDTTCSTNSAVVNFANNSVSSDSGVSGRKAGTKFTANGFFVDDQGKIVLRKAKIKKA